MKKRIQRKYRIVGNGKGCFRIQYLVEFLWKKTWTNFYDTGSTVDDRNVGRKFYSVADAESSFRAWKEWNNKLDTERERISGPFDVVVKEWEC